MKQKILLLSVCIYGFALANATPVNHSDAQHGKKEDLVGVVVNSESKVPLKNVSITAYSISKKEKVVITDESGSFSFDELKPGSYKFVFEKTGFRRVTKEKILLKSDEAFQMNIEMLENNDFDLMPSPFHFFSVI